MARNRSNCSWSKFWYLEVEFLDSVEKCRTATGNENQVIKKLNCCNINCFPSTPTWFFFSFLFYLLFIFFLVQSRAIARFLAGRHGLLGTDEWQAARIDALIDFVGDVANGKLSNYYSISIFSSDDDDKLHLYISDRWIIKWNMKGQ